MTDFAELTAGLTPEQRALLLRRLGRVAASNAAVPDTIPHRPEDGEPPPASQGQERLWFLDRLDPGNPAFDISYPVRLRGRLDAGALERALREVVRRHESLRTTFAAVNGRPVQRISADGGVRLEREDLSALSTEELEREMLARVQRLGQCRFRLDEGPLLRAVLLRMGADDHVLVLVVHHIVSDGWSLTVLFRELAAVYGAHLRGEASPLPPPALQYADWAAWQRTHLSGGRLQALLGWWRERLAGAPALLDLPTDRPRPPSGVHPAGAHRFRLPAATAQALRALARDAGATPFMALLAVFYATLARWSGQHDLVVGTPVGNRSRVETEDVIGFFLNTLPLRVDLSGDPSFREALARVREAASEAFAHQEFPFEKLVEALQPERSLSHNPVFQAMFVLQNATEALRLPGLAMEVLPVDRAVAQFDLTLTLTEGVAGGVGGALDYSAELFDAATMERFAHHYICLARLAAESPDAPLSALPLMDEAELRRVVVEWNATDAELPRGRCIHHLFGAHARRGPGAPAVRFRGETVSYGELRRRALAVARVLRERGVGPESRVGVCMDRSPDSVAAVLGVLMAGGAFLPLDPAYPRERLAYMLNDSGASLLLASRSHAELVPGHAAECVCLDDVFASADAESRAVEPDAVASRRVDPDEVEGTESESREPVSARTASALEDEVEIEPDGDDGGADPLNLAYVIYTSGSTGRPKGVGVPHLGLVNVAMAQRAAFGVGPGDRVLQFASPSFDTAVYEVVGALALGAELVLGTRDEMLPGPDLAAFLEREGVTVAILPPAALAVTPAATLPALRALSAAGEACPAEVVRRWAPGRRFFNEYGPTEATIWSTTAQCAPGTGAPPIGRPVPNVRVYVLDGALGPVPVGVRGELYVGGVGVARGYLGRPALTAERFVPDPFAREPGARLYRTGDMARWREDGQLEFAGRADDQVKVRGFRIEPGEVESALREHPAVRDAAVAARRGALGDARLVGWIVPADVSPHPAPPVAPAVLARSELLSDVRAHLAERLPPHMIPSALVAVDALPLSPNGKVDRRALPDPGLRPDRASAPPAAGAERVVAEVWQEALGVSAVGADDNFFEVGGHSLLLVRVRDALAERFGRSLPLTDLFRYPTVAMLAAHLRGGEAAPDPAAVETSAVTPAGGGCVHERVAAVAARFPERLAVEDEAGSVTYAELDGRANRLARFLRGRGIGAEARVALLMERSAELVVAALGVLKAGGAFVPLDPAWPRERIDLVLRDVEASLVLTLQRLRVSLPEDVDVVAIDADWHRIATETADPVDCAADPRGLAYVMYTSGSTGTPKGVQVEHASLANLVDWHLRAFDIAPDDRATMLAGVAFDASVWEVWPYLCAGASLHAVPEAVRLSPPALRDWLAARGITRSFVPTPLAERLLALEWLYDAALRTLLTGGDALHVRPRAGLPFTVVNNYGPTEATVVATSGAVSAGGEGDGDRVPTIGRAVANVRVHVLDDRLREVADGTAGELYVGGEGVARGYWRRPGQTAESFVPDPFSSTPGARLYRTGDRARIRPDGELEFLGRVDDQVKVRGVRIEPGEVEAALRRHPAVGGALAVARKDAFGEKRLVAYVVPRDGARPTTAELRRFLAASLPEPMIPGAFVVLDAFPLGASGKIDRQALPAPELASIDGVDGGVDGEPRTPAEAALCGIVASVLRVPRIGIHDRFLDLGGHSLNATQVSTRIHTSLGVQVPVGVLLRNPSVAELAVEFERLTPAAEPAEPIRRVPRDGPIPAGLAQEAVWFFHQLAPQQQAYHFQSTLRLHGLLHVEALESALNEIVGRHEAFRTTFAFRGGRVLQEIHEHRPTPLPVTDLAGLPLVDRDEKLGQVRREEFARPFVLHRLPLVRWRLVRLSTDVHELVHVEHHLVHDGWSFGVFLRELKALYEAFRDSRPPPLAPLTMQFADFAAWQREWLEGPEGLAQRDHWRARLMDEPPVLELPADRPRPAHFSFRGAAERWTAPPRLVRAARACARRERTTLYVVALAAFQALLHRHTGQEELCVGISLANRRRPELEPLIGMLVNMLPLRTSVSGGESFSALVARVHGEMLSAHAHQEVPFETIVQDLHPGRTLRHNPLFQVAFNFHTAPMPAFELGGARLVPTEAWNNGFTKFDLNVLVIPRAEQRPAGGGEGEDDEVTFIWEYATDLFDRATIQRMIERYAVLLEAACADPHLPIDDLPLLGAEERRSVLREWPGVVAADGDAPFAHERFQAQAARTPGAVAAVHEGAEFTYGELNERASRLAAFLRARGVGPESRVGIFLRRSPEMLAAVLAALKAGAAYVPLDPAYPPDRLAFMLADSGVQVLLTRSGLSDRLSAHAADVVRLDADWPEIAIHDAEDRPSGVVAENLAYLIYTSGSTGRPKGVAMTHGPLANLLRREANALAPAVTLQLAPVGFDVSFQEMFSTWATGGRLVLVAEEVRRDPLRLLEAMERHGVERVFLPFAMLRSLAAAAARYPVERLALREIVTAGEALHVTPAVGELLRRTGARLENQYGPTEGHVVSTHVVEKGPGGWPEHPPIGRPVPGVRLYVLDGRMRPSPIGVPGELHIGGAAVVRGYWRRPALTAEKLVPSPFADEPGARLYRTGDRARWLPMGELEFLGRADRQVKIRGFRVEPGEVESCLRRAPGVRDCLVAAREDGAGEPRLVAYVVLDEQGEVDADALRRFLRSSLPDAMIPSAFVPLAAFPLSPNGKVDLKALPAPEAAHGVAPSIEGPRTEVERTLCGIWQEVLGVQSVGVHDDFFALGGHSLSATQVQVRIHDAFHVALPLEVLFDAPTVAGTAAAIEERLPQNRTGDTVLRLS
jgi:amino acid adenylation domain-containing protein